MNPTVRPNSLAAYLDRDNSFVLGQRALAVYSKLAHIGPATERQLLALLFPGSDDMNKVRPRVTDLIKARYVTECGETRDPHTGKMVRVVRALTDAERDAVFAREKAAHGQRELMLA